MFPQPAIPKNRHFYATEDEVVLKTLHGFNLFIDQNSPNAAATTFGDRDELRTEIFVKKTLRGSDWAIIFDAGDALLSMLAAQSVGTFGRVYVYAPNERSLELISKSAVANRMHDRVIVRLIPMEETAPCESNENIENSAIIAASSFNLDNEFPIDLPIKVMIIDVGCFEATMLERARRLVERRCIDFILIRILSDAVWPTRWRRELGGIQWSRLFAQLRLMIASGYVACNLTKDGDLIERENVISALDNLDGRDLVLKATEQYVAGYQHSFGDAKHAQRRRR